jgi:1-acyl-sn-glycerol-3-phosphate acyltransferase
MRTIIACIKLFFFGLLCLITIPVQAVWQLITGNSRFYFWVPIAFNSIILFLFRIKVSYVGEPPEDKNVIFVGNHLSYIDIPVLGSHLRANFIAKADVRQWPIFGTLANISRTIFIERDRNAATKCISDIGKSLNKGQSLILFPEGTSTQGVEVYPFKSSIFELFLHQDLKNRLIIQPFTISIKQVYGQDILSASDNDLYAWHGDMTLPPHLWQLAKSKSVEVQVELHKARLAKNYENRKNFAKDCHSDVELGLNRALPAPLKKLK